MEFRILGPLEVVTDDGRTVAVPAAKQRTVLVVLLLSGDAPVAGTRLIDALWVEPPPSARKVVQTYVSKLRQVLPPGVLLTRATGYVLSREPDELDAARFERLLADAGRADPEREAVLLREALRLWRGRALEDFRDEPFAAAEVARLEGLRLTALVRRGEVDLAAGRHELILGELAGLVEQVPMDERLRGQLMLALYRSGRQAEALRLFREGRRFLAEELGVEPGPALQRLQQLILRHDPSLELGAVPVPGTPGAETREPAGAAARTVDSGGDLEGDASLASGPRRPGSAFVGRARELGALRTLFREHVRCVTLTGPAGTGKTRLALEATRLLAGEYGDGSAVVDLSGVRDPSLVAATVCSDLHLAAAGPDDSVTVLTDHLAPRHELVLLDNFEQVAAAAPLLGRLVNRAPNVAFLVTSRAPLGLQGEHVLPVEPLEVPRLDAPLTQQARSESVVLFIDRARAVRPGLVLSLSDVSDVARLCTRVDGLPLALELAAARVDVLSPRGILARLDERLDLLATDAASVPERHRSLRAAVDWSIGLLDEVEQETFSDLSVFVGGFTVGTAEDVVPRRDRLVVDVVRSLLRASLLRSEGAPGGEPRFGMLESVRECGLERLSTAGRADRSRRAHAEALLRLAEEAETELRGPDQQRWLSLLVAELPNIRQALGWAAAEEPDTGLRIAGHLWRFWQVRGLVHEARSHLERLLALPTRSDSARATGHLGVARCAFVEGDVTALHAHVGASLPVHRRHHDSYSESFALMLQGTARGRAEDSEEGATLLRQALDVARRSGDAWLEAACRGYLGMVESARGRHAEGRAALEEGLRGVREAGDSRLMGWFLIALGRTALASHDDGRARRRFGEALDLERRLGDDWGVAWALQGLAGVALLVHDHRAAADLAARSIPVARRAHSRSVVASGLRLLAAAASHQGRCALAVEILGSASLLSERDRDPWAFETDGFVGVDDARLRATVGQPDYHEHWALGRAMTIDETLTRVRAEL